MLVVATAGYSPLVRSSNTLQSQDCSDDPLIGPELNVTFMSPFQADLEWTLLNRRMGIDFTPLMQLYVTNCTVNQNGSIDVSSCVQFAVQVQTNTSHSLPTVPFMEYQFEVRGPTTRSATVQVRSPEIGMLLSCSYIPIMCNRVFYTTTLTFQVSFPEIFHPP